MYYFLCYFRFRNAVDVLCNLILIVNRKNMKNKKIKICCPYCRGVGYRYFRDIELKGLFNDDKNSPERTEKIIALRKEGMTYREIGIMYDLTKQRVCQIVKREGGDVNV